ncbi:unnamed protein product [Microthlaspi erraticum]|uniref:Uncharacterized protein n=1 Tax=Microthlaspi erraticum TaxID=1685480 RepID=A0A6D2K647_9BRAS|nr:unnamed protein product [Microthlaspi erraticum]
MSRTQVMIKLVKTGPDGLIEHSHPEPRTPADQGTNVPRSCHAYHPRPAKSTADPMYRPGRHCPAVGQITFTRPKLRDRTARTGRQRLAAARHNSRTAQPGRLHPASGQDSSAKTFHPSDPSAEHENSRPRSFRPCRSRPRPDDRRMSRPTV